MKLSRRLAAFVFAVILVGVVSPVTAQNDSLGEVYEDDLAADQRQIDIVNANLMPIGNTDMYRFGDNPSGTPTLSDAEAGYMTPTFIGAYQFQWNNPDQIPNFPDRADAFASGLGANINGGPFLGQTYVVFTAVMADDIPFGPDDDEFHKNFAFILSVHGHEGWVPLSQFPGDTWSAAAYVLNILYGPEPWNSRIYEVRGGDLKQAPADGFSYISGNVVVFGVNAQMFGTFGDNSQFMDNLAWVGFGWAGHVHDGRFGSCGDCPSKITTYPSTPRSEGDTFPVPIYLDRVLKPGYDPRADITDAWLIVDDDGILWINLKLDEPLQDGKLPDLFSFFLGSGVFDGANGAFFSVQTHNDEKSSLGSGPDGEFDVEAYGMSDGSLLVNTGLPYDTLNYPLNLQLQSGFQPTEDVSPLFSNTQRPITMDDLVMDDPLAHDGLFPIYDFGTDEMLDPPASSVTTTTEQPASSVTTTTTEQPATAVTTTTTEQPATAVTTTTQQPPSAGAPTPTPEDDGSRPGSVPVCWWCWAIVMVLLAFLICAIFAWCKVEEWWSSWLVWFLVIFIWVLFVLAGLIFWTPW